jgi:2-polyprenyl-3-methyl-5-hydroxy-6-metoxy-1,4-benzoquinol methylase
MAQLYTWDRQGFENAYWTYYYKIRGCGASAPRNCRCHDTHVSYSKKFFDELGRGMFVERATNIVSLLGLQRGETVLVAGCALGYLMEELKILGMIPYGFDNSTYIRGIKNAEKVKFDIPSIDLLSDTFVYDLNREFKVAQFDCVITEDVLPSYDDYTTMLNNCELVLKSNLPKTRIVHIVHENANAPFSSKTMSQWRQIKPEHTWLNENGMNI